MIKGLDLKDPFEANRETSFPREDYTPYVTYVDCRDQGGPLNGPGSPQDDEYSLLYSYSHSHQALAGS